MFQCNRVFSCDVTVAMLLSLNKGTAVMLVSLTNSPGIELYSYANVFFCLFKFIIHSPFVHFPLILTRKIA